MIPASTDSWPPSCSPTSSTPRHRPPPSATIIGASYTNDTTISSEANSHASAAARSRQWAMASSRPSTAPPEPSAAPKKSPVASAMSTSKSAPASTSAKSNTTETTSPASASPSAPASAHSPNPPKCSLAKPSKISQPDQDSPSPNEENMSSKASPTPGDSTPQRPEHDPRGKSGIT